MPNAFGDLLALADIIGGTGIVTHEAFFPLRAAEQLVRTSEVAPKPTRSYGARSGGVR